MKPSRIAVLILIETEKKTTDQELKEIVDINKAYPKEYDSFKKRMDQILESLDKLKELN